MQDTIELLKYFARQYQEEQERQAETLNESPIYGLEESPLDLPEWANNDKISLTMADY